MAAIVPIVLVGGGGSRLWPLSTPALPKQFLRLHDDEDSLFEASLRRTIGAGLAPPLVVGNAAHEAIIEESARRTGIELGGLILEPEARDSAAAIAAAAAWVDARHGAAAILAVMPADHHIPDIAAFQAAVRQAAAIATDGFMVTLGVAPDRPAVEFGYIGRGEAVAGHPDAYVVARFEEKPSRATAEACLAAGRFDWNAGMLIVRADIFRAEAEHHMPDIHRAATRAVGAALNTTAICRLEAASFAAIRKISIDYALLEASQRVAVLPVAFAWSDVGNWRGVGALLAADAAGNRLKGEVRAHDCAGTLVIAPDIPVRVVGLENVGVIATREGILVVALDHPADVGNIPK